jgi:Ni,Fe-hydrogenase I large subunit
VRAVEDALGIRIPNNARIIRNLIEGIQYVQDHVIHFYHLHALDWVDITSALQADPAGTASLAQSISNWHNSSAAYFQGVKDKLAAFVNSGQLGPFANGYWGHPAYKLPPEANLMAVAHYLEALEWQKDVIRVHAILGSKNPHPQTYLVGGMAITVDPDSESAINSDKLALIRKLFAKAKQFVEQVYIPDLLAVASFYKEWAGYGEGLGNFMVYGEFPDAAGNLLFPQGVILDGDLSTVHPLDHTKISEYVTHSWYQYEGGEQAALHPWDGETQPNYTGPQPPYDFLQTDGKYTWLKAPRYEDRAVEVGPLARALVAYASGQPRVVQVVNSVLETLGVGAEALFSTLGRTAARGIETLVVAEQLIPWVDELVAQIADGDYTVCNTEKWDPATWPAEAQGWGPMEAPRGALGHWVRIKDQKIENYQCVVPSTWNASPRDASGQPGAYEAALIGTPLEDPEQPVELLRTIHSFDPCMACAVHLVDPQRRELTRIQLEGRM